MATTQSQIRNFYFSPAELKRLTDWPDVVIEFLLSMSDSIVTISEGTDTNNDYLLIAPIPVRLSGEIAELESAQDGLKQARIHTDLSEIEERIARVEARINSLPPTPEEHEDVTPHPIPYQEMRFGNGLNYTEFEFDGTIKLNGTARIGWQKITANSVTLDAGTTPAGVVGDLQSLDGTSYHIDEAAATPGQDLKVDFIDVTAFNWVQVVANYSALVTAHSVSIQLYNWNTAAWVTFHSQLPNQQTPVDHSFFVPDDTEFIGTGGDVGRVRVRFNHTQAGNALHDNDIDVVALYQ